MIDLTLDKPTLRGSLCVPLFESRCPLSTISSVRPSVRPSTRLPDPVETFETEKEPDVRINRRPGPTLPITSPPDFDMHKVEEALLENHKLYNGTPLTRAEAKAAIEEYRAFLAKHKAAGAPDRFEVPSLLVDRVWHTHICETRQYRDDCQGYFGKIIEHQSSICNGGGGSDITGNSGG